MSLTTTVANPGSGGQKFAIDQRSSDSAAFPLSKLVWGAADTFTLVDTGAGLPISDAGGSLTVDGTVAVSTVGGTVAISAASLPLPTGAATAAKQPALGTAGSASTDVLTVQGIAGGTALPASQSGNWSVRAQDGSGNSLTSRVTGSSRPLEIAVLDGSGNQITSFGGSGGTASNVGSAVPSTATAGGWSDGTNMQLARVFDADSGAGTQYVAGVNLRLSSSGGSVEAGTASNPLRTDPTGTTIQPVNGTITANIGTSGSLALETGGNLATVATNTTGLNSTVGTAASAIPSRVLIVGGSDGTNARALKVNTSGQADIRPLTSADVVSAAQSGTWTVGLSAAQTLATVTTVSTVTSLSQWAGNAIDTNSGNRSAGTLRVVLATDQPALTNALKVDPSAVTSPVSLASVPTHGVNIAASATSSGASVYTAVSASGASNNAANVKASAGQVLGLWAMNLNAAARFIKFFNKASSPTPGTDTVIAQVVIPGNTTGAGVVIQFPCPLPFSTGISYAITGGISLTDNTSISGGDVALNIQYV